MLVLHERSGPRSVSDLFHSKSHATKAQESARERYVWKR